MKVIYEVSLKHEPSAVTLGACLWVGRETERVILVAIGFAHREEHHVDIETSAGDQVGEHSEVDGQHVHRARLGESGRLGDPAETDKRQYVGVLRPEQPGERRPDEDADVAQRVSLLDESLD